MFASWCRLARKGLIEVWRFPVFGPGLPSTDPHAPPPLLPTHPGKLPLANGTAAAHSPHKKDALAAAKKAAAA